MEIYDSIETDEIFKMNSHSNRFTLQFSFSNFNLSFLTFQIQKRIPPKYFLPQKITSK